MSEKRYKVAVDVLTPGDQYPKTCEIYSQVVDELDLVRVIQAVNALDESDLERATRLVDSNAPARGLWRETPDWDALNVAPPNFETRVRLWEQAIENLLVEMSHECTGVGEPVGAPDPEPWRRLFETEVARIRQARESTGLRGPSFGHRRAP